MSAKTGPKTIFLKYEIITIILEYICSEGRGLRRSATDNNILDIMRLVRLIIIIIIIVYGHRPAAPRATRPTGGAYSGFKCVVVLTLDKSAKEYYNML